MKAVRNRAAELNRIHPDWVAAYLRARGWTPEHAFRDIESYWRSSDSRAELILPLKAEFGDFALRMSELVDLLADTEERSQWQVVRDLLTANMDVVSLRVDNEDAEDGSIALHEGVELFESARSMLISAARAFVERRPMFVGGPPSEVSRYLKTVRMGQTERGSYVVNLLSPIAMSPEQQSDDPTQLFDEQEYSREELFARSVMTMLSKALQSAQEATEKSKDDPTYRAFINAIPSGVSANLCEALAKVNESGSGRGLQINLRWAYTLPEQGQQRSRFEFDSSSAPVLRGAAAILKESDPFENYTLMGYVIGLQRDKLIDLGQVTIKADIGEVSRKVLVDLGGEDYSKAVAAHESRAPITIQGRLRHKGTRWFLETPRRFSILEDRPLSNNSEEAT